MPFTVTKMFATPLFLRYRVVQTDAAADSIILTSTGAPTHDVLSDTVPGPLHDFLKKSGLADSTAALAALLESGSNENPWLELREAPLAGVGAGAALGQYGVTVDVDVQGRPTYQVAVAARTGPNYLDFSYRHTSIR